MALATQACKAVHQVALDQGKWSTATLLLPLEDPLGRDDFAGEEAEMKDVHAYRKALDELRASHASAREPESDLGRSPTLAYDKKEGQWKTKGKAKDKAKAKENGKGGGKDG